MPSILNSRLDVPKSASEDHERRRDSGSSDLPAMQTPIPIQCPQTAHLSPQQPPHTSLATISATTSTPTHSTVQSTRSVQDTPTDFCCLPHEKKNTGLDKINSLAHIIIVETLNPSNQTQHRQYLRLDSQRDIEVPNDVIHAQWHTSAGPEKHHGRLQPDCVMPAVIDDYLGDQLDGPADLWAC